MPVISVLWGLGVLTAIALSLLWNGTMSYSLARNGLSTADIQATVDAAISRAVIGLLDPRPDRAWRTDGVAQTFAFEGTTIDVSVQDELGKIDLNHADAPAFIALLQAGGLNRDAAANLADKILDWRTDTSLKHLNGAKAAEYEARGSATRPRNGPFQSVDELKLVMDMTPALFQRIALALTVYSGNPSVDPKLAPREVLLTLPGATPEQVDAALQARSRPGALTNAVAVPASLRGRAFTIRASFRKLERTITGEAIVRLSENPAQPYWLLSWRLL
jgi:general secretion pathway protein K